MLKATKIHHNIVWHVLLWGAYVIMEYVANIFHLSEGDHWRFIRSVLLALPLIMVPTYFMALYALPRFLQQRRISLFMVSVILAAAIVYYGRIKWMELVNYINYDSFFSPPPSKIFKNVIRDYAVIALAVCIYIIADWKRKEKLTRQLLEAKSKMEIQLLKSQLHPHFLFNTLNNLYSLAMQKSDRTAMSILKLSELLEYLVYQSDKERASLVSEIKLIHNYFDLEKLRYGKTLDLQLDIDNFDPSIKTAPLILLPFVENCFKHGGKDVNGIFWIKLSLKQHDQLIVLRVANSKSSKQRSGNFDRLGVGLANIRERLELIYPGQYALNIEDSEEHYTIHLELQINAKV